MAHLKMFELVDGGSIHSSTFYLHSVVQGEQFTFFYMIALCTQVDKNPSIHSKICLILHLQIELTKRIKLKLIVSFKKGELNHC